MLPASLIPLVSPAVRATLDHALLNIGVCEEPPGSNRGPEIDAWCKEFGSPLGSYWCAITVGKSRKVGGCWLPSRDVGSCDEWVYQAFRAAKWMSKPEPGAAVVYTNWSRLSSGRYAGQYDAVHIGHVLRVTPRLLAVEGNTVVGKYDRNGYVQAMKPIDTNRVYGYILP